jgi:cysteinyl-tRNA synthetase
MTIRFFILQAHYRSTLDFSNEALQAAEAGLQKLHAAMKLLPNLKSEGTDDDSVKKIQDQCYAAMDKDMNTAVLIAQLFDGVRLINAVNEGHKTIGSNDLETLKTIFQTFAIDILGLNEEANGSSNQGLVDGVIKMLLQIRLEAKNNKDFATSDRIRNELASLGVIVKDRKDGFDWEIK